MSDYTLKLWILCQTLLEDAKDHVRKLERGQGMVEYSLILALVSIAAITILVSLGTNLNDRFTQIRNCLDATSANTPCVSAS